MGRFLSSTATGLAVAMFAPAGMPLAAQDRPNILVVWGDDIGQSNTSS